MPGTVYDMTGKEFFKRLLIHFTLALVLWYAALIALERLIPGFVSPFVDLAQIGLCSVLVLAACLAVCKREAGNWRKIVSLILFLLCAAAAVAFLCTRVAAYGNWMALLIGCAVVLLALATYVLWFERFAP